MSNEDPPDDARVVEVEITNPVTMDPQFAHPAPWHWNGVHGGIVATTALLDATGSPVVNVASGMIAELARLEIHGQHEREMLAAAPEMLALLRESPQYGCSVDSVKRCMFVTADGVECWYHRRAALLARIDAAKAG